MRIQDILLDKINEIQSRVPVKMKSFEKSSFASLLDGAMTAGSAQYADSTLKEKNPYMQTAGQSLLNNSLYRKITDQAIEDNINRAAEKYQLDPSLIRAVMKQESGFNPYAVSRAGAQGLMQLMPGTAAAMNVSDPWNVAQNIDGGAKYLSQQLKAFNGNLKYALAAYNAGPENVRKYNGVPPFEETKDYVTKVLNNYNSYLQNEEDSQR